MEGFPASRLFTDALAPRDDDHFADRREKLRRSYLSARERSLVVAADIRTSLPDFTDHDEKHIDALWDMADIVGEPAITLNPAEAYVFGIAVLIHDLGLALASYPAGRASLHEDKSWEDALGMALRSRLGRAPTAREIEHADADAIRSAEQDVLRRLHAVHAEELATFAWTDEDGVQLYLVEDSELRDAYGPLIGRIAHSHWWETSRVGEEFKDVIGAPDVMPREWAVDPLTIACLLRIADAIHLDARRAPRFLRALQRPTGVAKDHWKFQALLNRPHRSDGRLAFSGQRDFRPDESAAWWLCHDTLASVDTWLSEVDAVLSEAKRTPLMARGVVGIGDVKRLKRLIRTQGWEPVDTTLQVSNVVELVRRLGGEQLYGANLEAPVRELIQNGADAIRARRALQSRPADWGEITVELSRDGGEWWLAVTDTGVGMSDRVLTKGLLDFGTSFWATAGVAEEFPGLVGRGFQPTGQYGIGFFSIFMLGDLVRIFTRPYRAAEPDSRVLEFASGLASRPLLRDAREDERLIDGGTRVEVRLHAAPDWLLGWNSPGPRLETLSEFCAGMAPALDVRVKAVFDGTDTVAVEADDWKTISADGLAARSVWGRRDDERPQKSRSPLVANLRPLVEPDGTMVGRAFIAPTGYRLPWSGESGVVSVGGLRSARMGSVCGVLLGYSQRASRDVAVPVVSTDTLRDWATEQANLLESFQLDGETQAACAAMIEVCGGDTGPLTIAASSQGWLTRAQITAWAQPFQEVVLVQDAWFSLEERRGPVDLRENVLVLSTSAPGAVQAELRGALWPDPVKDGYLRSLSTRVQLDVTGAWNLPLPPTLSQDGELVTRVIGDRDGAPVTYDRAEVIQRF